MSNLRHRVGDKLEAMGDKLEAVEEKSKDLIHGFIGLFGRDGRIVSECDNDTGRDWISNDNTCNMTMCVLESILRASSFMTRRKRLGECSRHRQ